MPQRFCKPLSSVQGRPVGEDSVKTAISAAHHEAMTLITAQQALPKKEQSSVSFQLAGADVAARQRVFDTGQKDVEKVLRDTELQPWEVSPKLEEVREEVLEGLSRSGFFRFDVRELDQLFIVLQGSICVSATRLDTRHWECLFKSE